MTTTAMMRAIRQDTLGGPDVLREVTIPRPTPGVSEILVAVHAAGVNPTDWRNRAAPMTVSRLPLTLGWDVSGVVESVGPGVTLFEPGDEVFGMLPYPDGVGSHAEYVTGPARAFARKPDSIDHVQAGALPLAALTAHQALVDTGGVRQGQRVVILAAGGGVGHLAVQIAKAHGAHVVATASAGKHDFVRSLGADEVIDHHEVDHADVVADVDIVLDPLSMTGADRRRSARVLRTGGTLVSILPVPVPDDELAEYAERGIRYASLLVEADRAGMLAVADLVDAGRLTAHVDAVFPLEHAAKAHALGETGHTTGKIVLTVDHPRPADVARRLLDAMFRSGDEGAIDAVMSPDYVQHNPAAGAGRPGSKEFAAFVRSSFPDADLRIHRAISDGDLTLLHNETTLVPGGPTTIALDIFRVEDGVAVEHWDVLQENDAPGDDLFATRTEPQTTAARHHWSTDHSRATVTTFATRLLVERDLSAVDDLVDPGLRTHVVGAADGADATRDDWAQRFRDHPHHATRIHHLIAEGDLVGVHSHQIPEPGDQGVAVIDLFRVRGGRIVEHWGSRQPVPEPVPGANTMF